MMFGDEEETGETEPAPVPATANSSSFGRFPVKVNAPAPVFHPLAYRGVVAEWPVEWRERWGRRPMRSKRTGYPGVTPRRRRSSKSGTSCAAKPGEGSGDSQHGRRQCRAKLADSTSITGNLSSPLSVGRSGDADDFSNRRKKFSLKVGGFRTGSNQKPAASISLRKTSWLGRAHA